MKVQYLTRIRAGFISAIFLILALGVGIAAQETVSTASGSGSGGSGSESKAQDDDLVGGFKIKSSIEFGIRSAEVDGNENKYKSDLNYDSGARLFNSSFYVTAPESGGKPFDELLITSSGWGGDPGGFARIGMGKIGWYQFDANIRSIKYFNNVLNFAVNEHNRDTVHNMGDFDLTILPQNELIKFRVGYSYDRNDGDGETTFDYDRDEFPLHFDYDTKSYDLRFGADVNLGGLNISFTEGYRNFKDDTSWFINGLVLGENPSPNASLDTFSRLMPIEGKTNYHRITAHKYFKGIADITGRFIYSDTEANFTLNEMITGTNRSGVPIILDQYTSSGDTSKPNGTGDIGVTFFLGDRVQISNTFGVTSYRISGGNTLLNSILLGGGTLAPLGATPIISNDLVYRFTSYRRYMNTLEGSVDVHKQFGFYLGYRYTDRKVELRGLDADLTSPSSSTFTEEAENKTNTFLAGFTAQPVYRKWKINFAMEHGDGDNPFTRLGNNEFTQIKVKNQVTPTDDLTFSVSFETKDNSNPGLSVSDPNLLLLADVKTRTFGANLSYMPDPNFTLNGGYNYTYLNAVTDVSFPTRNFGNGVGTSIYDLRNNFAYIDAWVRPHNRFSIFGAYRISKDTGDGDDFIGPSRSIIGNYPLTFQSPEVRAIIKINENADVNFGYQYFDYDEKFDIGQNYNAHLPYISLTLYLGRRE